MRATTYPTSFEDSPYISHSDAAEYNRMKDLAGSMGYGETIGDEDTELYGALAEITDLDYDVPDGRS